MSDTAPIGNLPTYEARAWTTGESITRTKVQSEFDKIEALLTLCKSALTDIQNHRHGDSTPTENNIAGQIWAKKISAARTQLFLDPDGAGADDQVLTETEAYNADCKTAGTGTVKLGGPINVNTTDVTSGALGALIPYSLPADTLSVNGDVLRMIGFGIESGGGAGGIGAVFGGTALSSGDQINETKWIAECMIVRVSATSQKMVWCYKITHDNVGSTGHVDVASPAETFTGAVTAEFEVTGISSAPIFTQSALIVRLN